jgi:hypothetical protein
LEGVVARLEPARFSGRRHRRLSCLGTLGIIQWREPVHTWHTSAFETCFPVVVCFYFILHLCNLTEFSGTTAQSTVMTTTSSAEIASGRTVQGFNGLVFVSKQRHLIRLNCTIQIWRHHVATAAWETLKARKLLGLGGQAQVTKFCSENRRANAEEIRAALWLCSSALRWPNYITLIAEMYACRRFIRGRIMGTLTSESN